MNKHEPRNGMVLGFVRFQHWKISAIMASKAILRLAFFQVFQYE